MASVVVIVTVVVVFDEQTTIKKARSLPAPAAALAAAPIVWNANPFESMNTIMLMGKRRL